MASIQTGIQLNDQFTGVIYSIINSVNIAVSTMEDMQHTMNTNVDNGAFEGMRNEITQATMALDELSTAMSNMNSSTPSIDTSGPVQWNTDSLEVFTGTGTERFQQEMQSVNGMMQQLCSTQDRIAKQAYNTMLFPPESFQDLNELAVRIDMVRNRIQQIENNPVNIRSQTANAELEQLRSQLDQAVQEQNELNQAMQNMDVSAANNAYLRLSSTIGNTERYIRENVDEQGMFNQEINKGISNADNLMNTIKGFVGAYVSIQAVGNMLNISDSLVQNTSRLNLMNDGLQSTEELVNMVYASAQDARGSFSDMTNVIARFGNNAKDAFSSSAEVVAFANLVQKQMTIAGASTTEASNAMLQLSQGLGSGVLRGDELNSIFEQAPNLIQNIADYLDVPIGTIRDMASEGELTADIIKNAIFAASDEINAKFEEMPMTWGQVWQSIQNGALKAFQPVLQRINKLANNDSFQNFVNGVMEAMTVLAIIVLDVFDLLATVGAFVNDNWGVIEPIIIGVAAAFGVYTTALVAYNTVQAISNGLAAISAAREAFKAKMTIAEAAATTTATGAQVGLNAAMMACPLVWIVTLVIVLIALLVALCNWIAQTTGVATSGIGIIYGALMVVAAFIGNLFVTLINAIIDIIVVLWNFIAAFVNFLGNAFTDPVGAIARLFFDLVDCVLELLETLASAIDTIFGSSLSSAVQGWRDNLGSWVDDTFGKGEEVMATVNGEQWHLERFEYGEAWDMGVEVGDGLAELIGDFGLSDLLGATDMPNMDDYTSQFTGMTDSLDNISNDTGNISDAMDITEEDLKYLRDLAEQEVVNRYTVAEISVDMSGMQNTVNNGTDIDGFMSGLTEAVNEAVDSITEGVHE